ncbi:MAG: HU family DNA-binding protein [Clostridia bacterium]|nr:HU family DNA-binding protein [Clostridia bacterium]
MNTISTGDFVKQVAEATGCTQVAVKTVLDAAVNQIKANLKKGTAMHFIGFANFDIKSRAAKTGVNPFTKAKMTVPACKVPTVKLSASVRNLLK